MISIPNEILQDIFLYLSHKNILQCGLVCKDWYIFTRSPAIFRTIRLYNKKQFDGFIKMATTEKINNQYIGQLVKNIILQDYNNGLTEEMKVEDILQLYKACPNATFIDNIKTLVNTNLLEDSFWSSLSILPQWVQQRYPYWYQLLYHHQTCTSLSFTISNNNVIEKNHWETNNVTFDDEDGMKFIIFEKDEKPQKRRLLDYPVPKPYLLSYIFINDDNMFEVINDEQFLIYYAKVMSFTPKITKAFQHLKQLTIDFGTYSQYLIRKPERTLELDERTIESIHQSCPLLDSLTIKGFYMNMSPQYIKYVSSSSSSPTNCITPCLSLKKLSLVRSNIQHFQSFHYFSKKYPHLTSLSLDLFWFSNPTTKEGYANAFQLALHDMIEAFADLSSLSINLSFADMLNKYGLEETLWDQQRFLNWSLHRLTHITTLEMASHFYIDETTISTDDDDDDDQSNKNKNNSMNKKNKRKEEKEIISSHVQLDQRHHHHYHHDNNNNNKGNQHTYLDYLKKLTLHCYSSIPLTYKYFAQLINNHTISFSSLTLLSLVGVEGGFRTITKTKRNSIGSSNHIFYIYSWLNLIPTLNRLRLENLLITDVLDNSNDYDDFNNNNNNNDDDDDDDDLMKEDDKHKKNQKVYSLKELVIEDSYVYLNEDGLTHLGQVCPSLRIMKFINTCIKYDYGSNITDIVMDAPHITLDELFINRVYGSNSKKVSFVNELILKEASSSSSFNGQDHSTIQSSLPKKDHEVIKFILQCKYVDQVNFV